jgi:hypothetical protein
MKLASITILSLVLSPTGLINLGFITQGRLAAVLITPSLGVPNWSVIYINTTPSGIRVGNQGGGRRRSEVSTKIQCSFYVLNNPFD